MIFSCINLTIDSTVTRQRVDAVTRDLSLLNTSSCTVSFMPIRTGRLLEAYQKSLAMRSKSMQYTCPAFFFIVPRALIIRNIPTG